MYYGSFEDTIPGILALITILIIIGIWASKQEEYNANYVYEYTTVNGLTGIAQECYSYRGGPIKCKLEDGTIIQIESYKRILKK